MEVTRIRNTTTNLHIIEAYEKFTAAGLATLPTGEDKQPVIPKGESWKGGWNNLTQYHNSHGIAIICGAVSGGLECIDIDNHFLDANNILDMFLTSDGVSEIVDKHKIPLEKTVSGGFHLVYKCDLIEGSQDLARRPLTDKNGKTRPDAIIETKGEGGYFCADPTQGYEVYTGSLTAIPVITAEERRILLSACRSFDEVVTVPRKEEEATDRPGDIFNRSSGAVEEMKQALASSGWKELSEGLWRRPDKERGISATLGKAAEGIFYNFSQNGHPFEYKKGYSAFQVVGLLKYGGDFKTFAKDLSERQRSVNPVNNTVNLTAPVQTPEDKRELLIEQMELSRIDPLSDMTEPPVFCYIGNSPSFTAGNFSLFIGKPKSGKTFLLNAFVASTLNNSTQLSTIKGILPREKNRILYFDTEQSVFHANRTIKRICSLINNPNPTNLFAYSLRPYTPAERLTFIEEKINTTEGLGLAVIDGIRDLLTMGINDEQEATSLTSKFLKWTGEHDIHLMLLLHQNKTDLQARGHIGSECLNKAETTISVTHDKNDIFIVTCEYSRDIAFTDFAFIIADGQISESDLPKEEKAKSKNPQLINDEKHIQVLDEIFRSDPYPGYEELTDKIVNGFNYTFGRTACRDFITHYLKKGWISKGHKGNHKFYKYERALF